MFSLFPFRAFIVSGENEPVLTGKRTVLEENMNILESPGCCVFPGDCEPVWALVRNDKQRIDKRISLCYNVPQ